MIYIATPHAMHYQNDMLCLNGGKAILVEKAFTLNRRQAAEVFALRLLTVTRGDFGSTAATHLIAAPVTATLVPGDVRELAEAEALNTVYQKVSAYARTIGENSRPVPGGSLPDLRARVKRGFYRIRMAVI